MKKVMLALAIVACAAMAHAAQVGWQFQCGADEKMDGLTVYAFTSALDPVSAESIKTATSTGVISVGRKDGNAQSAIMGLSDDLIGKSQNVYLYVLDTTGEKYYATSLSTTVQNEQEGTVYTTAGDTSITLESFSAFSGGDTPEPSPEPTSAMLLLVGAAVTALRRRRV